MISIVIPAYKEKERLPKTLERIENYCFSKNYDFEIIVVIENDDIETKFISLEFKNKYNNIEVIENYFSKGKGGSVKSGVLKSKGDYIFFSDADLSTPIEEIDKFIILLNKGYDIVIGSRFLKESKILKYQPLQRRIAGYIFRTLRRVLLLKEIKDTQCGFKGFKRKPGLNIFSKLNIYGFAFDVEVLKIALKNGYSIKEIPVTWTNNPHSKVLAFKSSLEMLRDILWYRKV